jgi:hypothetical protein
MAMYRIIIYNGTCSIEDDFFIGKKDKSYYEDKDMKFLNLNYNSQFSKGKMLDARESARKKKRRWWKEKLLWNKATYYENIEDIKKYYEITIRIGSEVIILASSLDL